MSKLTKYEKETIVLFNEADEEAHIGLSTLFQTNFFRLFFRYCTGV